MIKTYIDWNVMSGMKQGHFPELTKILENREKFLLIYSTSHIGDILASVSDDEKQKIRVQEDLEYITRLTGNLCLAYDSKTTYLDRYDPQELLNDRLDEAHLFTDMSIDSLLKPIEGEGNEIANAAIASYKAMIKSLNLDSVFQQAFEQPETAEMLDKLFPGFRDDPTFEGLIKSFGKMYHNMNHGEDYKHLRDMVQKVGLSSGHFNPEKNPFELIEKAYEKMSINPDAYFEKGKNAPVWFDEITNEYLKLDLHGYKADSIVVNEKKKKTMRNVTEDASHSAFASRCEFYITNDDKNYHKTKKVFEKLGIFTHVLKPQEFIERYNNFLNFNSFEEHLTSASHVIQQGQNFQELQNEDGSFFGTVCYPPHYFFDFFNKITVPKSDDAPYFLLSKDHPANTYIVAYEELAAVVKKFVDRLGLDDDGKGELSHEEITGLNWEGRRWNTNAGEFRLQRLNGWFQMYLYFPPVEQPKPASRLRRIFMRLFRREK